jgi:hypothetical protein
LDKADSDAGRVPGVKEERRKKGEEREKGKGN